MSDEGKTRRRSLPHHGNWKMFFAMAVIELVVGISILICIHAVGWWVW